MNLAPFFIASGLTFIVGALAAAYIHEWVLKTTPAEYAKLWTNPKWLFGLLIAALMGPSLTLMAISTSAEMLSANADRLNTDQDPQNQKSLAAAFFFASMIGPAAIYVSYLWIRAPLRRILIRKETTNP